MAQLEREEKVVLVVLVEMEDLVEWQEQVDLVAMDRVANIVVMPIQHTIMLTVGQMALMDIQGMVVTMG